MEEKDMVRAINAESRATSGTIVNNFRSGYRVQISWKVNSQNVSNNTSNVTIRAQLVSTGSAYTIVSSATKNGSLTINGAKYSFTFNASLSGNQTKTVYTKTLDITHNNSGNKICSMSCDLGIAVTLGGTYYGTVSASGSGEFNSIPRTSPFSLNVSSAELGTTKIIVTINRASNSFTHKVIYKFGDINIIKTSSATDTYSFTPDISDCSQIPNTTSGTGTIVVETYSGDKLIGSNSKNITLTVPSSIVPSISSLKAEVIDAGASTSFGYVKGKSRVKLTIVGAEGNYSSISKYTIIGGNVNESSPSVISNIIDTSGDIEYSAYVIDSRGRKSDVVTIKINVKDYTNPKITSFSSFRCLENGKLSDDGTYLSTQAIFSYTVLSGATITSKVKFKETTATSWSTETNISNNQSVIIGGGNIATNKTYDVMITLSDGISTTTRSVSVGTAFVTIDFKSGGKGVAVGKSAEKDYLLDIAMELQMNSNKLKLTTQYNENPGIGYDNSSTDVFISNINNNWLRLKSDKTMTYADYKVYTSFDKPSASEIGALPVDGGGLITGTTSFKRGSDAQAIVVQTAGDANGKGDGQTHFGYYYNGAYSHYLRGKGALNVEMHEGINVSKGIKTGTSVIIGDYSDNWRSCTIRRYMFGKSYSARYAISYIGNVKLSSSSKAITMPACSIEIQDEDTDSTVRKYVMGTLGLMPSVDNNAYLGCSSHRWQAIYSSTGTVYSSSLDEKVNVVPIDISLVSQTTPLSNERKGLGNPNEGTDTLKKIIVEGIKSTPLYSYNYKNIDNDDLYIGFLGQEVKNISSVFFNLLGANFNKESSEEQYDIRESSVIGILWAGLQEALTKNEQLETEIQEIKRQLKM